MQSTRLLVKTHSIGQIPGVREVYIKKIYSKGQKFLHYYFFQFYDHFFDKGDLHKNLPLSDIIKDLQQFSLVVL